MKRLPLLIMLLFVPSWLAFAQWYVSYEKGRTAVENKDWQQAVAHLNAAIDEDAESQTNKKTYGFVFIDYFPYLYRGIAYYRLGELDKARADLEKEKSDGAINDAERDKGAPALLAQYLDLLQKPAPQTAQQKPPPVVQEKTPRVVDQKLPGNSAVTAPPLSQKKTGDQASGNQKKETSGKPLAAATPPKENPPAPHESARESAVPSADTAGSAFFREGISLLNAGKIGGAKSAFRQVSAVAPGYPQLADYLGTIGSFEQKTHTGISAFFRGDYAGAIENLGPASKSVSDNPHVFAFLACSYAAQYLLAGAEDGKLKREAVEAFGRVKGIDPRYELDRDLISPGIIALLKGE